MIKSSYTQMSHILIGTSSNLLMGYVSEPSASCSEKGTVCNGLR